jgi:hypothetical protein
VTPCGISFWRMVMPGGLFGRLFVRAIPIIPTYRPSGGRVPSVEKSLERMLHEPNFERGAPDMQGLYIVGVPDWIHFKILSSNRLYIYLRIDHSWMMTAPYRQLRVLSNLYQARFHISSSKSGMRQEWPPWNGIHWVGQGFCKGMRHSILSVVLSISVKIVFLDWGSAVVSNRCIIRSQRAFLEKNNPCDTNSQDQQGCLCSLVSIV